MGEIERFLSAVLAWGSGGYVWLQALYAKNPRCTKQGSYRRHGYTTAAELLRSAAAINVEYVDVYFCLSMQRSDHVRSKDGAHAFRALFCDIDVRPGDPNHYETFEEAKEALLRFCHLIGIPEPSWIVHSGHGLHAYWCSHRDLSVAEWRPIAEAFKTAAMAASPKLLIDMSVTADASRILRLPGTLNWKREDYHTHDPDSPQPVQLLPSSEAVYEFDVVFADMVRDFPYDPTARRPAGPQVGMASEFAAQLMPGDRFGAGIDVNTIGLVPFEGVKKVCGWLRHVYDTHGEHEDQPRWNQAVLCATFMQDGQTLAHEFSNAYPRYTAEDTNELWHRKNNERTRSGERIGWPSCLAIKDLGAEACQTCPLSGKGKSPLWHGYVAYRETITAEQIDAEVKELGGEKPAYLRLPPGFYIDEQSRISAYMAPVMSGTKLKSGGRLLWLFANAVPTAPRIEGIGEHYGIRFTIETTRGRTQEVFLSAHDTHSQREIRKAYAVSGALLNPDSEAKDMLDKFSTSWLDSLRKEDVSEERDLGELGWRYRNGAIVGFIYGGVFYRSDGSTAPSMPSVAESEFYRWYRPAGNTTVWAQASKLITDRKRPQLDLIIASAFAAPLTVFAGSLYGPVLVVWGDSGTAKTTAQQVASSVWGQPKQTRESLISTPKSILGRLGRTRNLPSFWDDVQDERHLEGLFNTMFVATEGAEGSRLNVDTSVKERKQWQTMMVVGANMSFVEFLTRKQKSTTAGMRRVFEVHLKKMANEPGMINALEASRTFASLEHHYGHVGQQYAKLLACEHEYVSGLVTEVINRFSAKVGANSDEAFWVGLCGVLLVGAMLSRTFGADIDIARLEHYLVGAFFENRRVRAEEGTEGGTYEHTEHALTGFINEHYLEGHFIVVQNRWFNRHTVIHSLRDPNTGKTIYIQVVRDDRMLIVSKRAFRAWLDKQDIRSRHVFTGLAQWFSAEEKRMTLGSGTAFAQTQEACFFIPVPEDGPLVEFLDGTARKA